MSEASLRPSPVLFACLALGLADLLFLNLVVFPRVGGHRPTSHAGTVAALPAPATGPVAPPDGESQRIAPPPEAPEPPSAAPSPADLREEIRFETGLAKLDAEGRVLIDRLAARLTTLPAGPLVIEGHADVRGDGSLNDQLSRERARAVMRRLVTLGIPRNRMVMRAFGARRPAAKGYDREALRRNRRVEISVRGGTS
jgi:outer membrane protein OmpA-like peptidoglycan-associated protein